MKYDRDIINTLKEMGYSLIEKGLVGDKRKKKSK
jgi:hypothetical protein